VIVVDSNVIAYLYIPGVKSAHAREALKRDPYWIAPRIWRSELRNVAIRYVRVRQIKITQAYDVLDAAEALMKGGEYEVESRTVLDLANNSGRSAYDCEFIALARQFKIKLITSDGPLADAFPSDTVDLGVFAGGAP